VETVADLENHLVRTDSTMIGLAANILGVDAAAAAKPAGMAYGLVGILRAFPVHASRGKLTLPTALLRRHEVAREDIFAGRASRGLDAVLADIRSLARSHLESAALHIGALPAAALPALLPIALVRPWLDCLERRGAFAAADIPPWRRQWLFWRAARNPARIAG
jgi:phytoene synthase